MQKSDEVSDNNMRWYSLVHLAEMLKNGEVKLDELATESNQNNEPAAADHTVLKEHKNAADHTVRKEYKNSSVADHHTVLKEIKNSSVVVPPNKVQGAKSGLKITYKIGKTGNVVCPQEPLSSKLTLKKPSTTRVVEDSTSVKDTHVAENQNSKRKRRLDSQIEVSAEKRVAKRSKTTSVVTNPGPTTLPEEVKKHILDSGGCLESVVLVIEKNLWATDVDAGEARLSIPFRQVKKVFLTESDVIKLKSVEKFKVGVVEPSLKECSLCLREWKKNNMYALVSGWKEVCKRNGLKQGMGIQLWSFRRNNELCFALVKIPSGC